MRPSRGVAGRCAHKPRVRAAGGAIAGVLTSETFPLPSIAAFRSMNRVTKEGAMIRRRLATVFLALLVASPVLAQTGQINGVITDNTGAVVPGVTVKAVEVATGLSRDSVTGADGRQEEDRQCERRPPCPPHARSSKVTGGPTTSNSAHGSP